MESILHDLFYGAIRPTETYYPKNKEDQKITKEFIEKQRLFLESLEDKQKKQFLELMDYHVPDDRADIFADGFCLGIKIMAEVYRE